MTEQRNNTAGARWVERYLLPLLPELLLRSGDGRLTCLQIEPADQSDCYDEANRLKQEGHQCDVLLCACERLETQRWQHTPELADPTNLPLDSERYDLILTGRFGRMASTPERRHAFARELARVCKTNGGLLTTIGNRLCPIDLSGNDTLLHSPTSQTLVTLREMEELFVQESGFSAIYPLSVAGHFGWSRVWGPGKLAAWMLESYWRWLAVPHRRWLYASPLNPVLLLWIVK